MSGPARVHALAPCAFSSLAPQRDSRLVAAGAADPISRWLYERDAVFRSLTASPSIEMQSFERLHLRRWHKSHENTSREHMHALSQANRGDSISLSRSSSVRRSRSQPRHTSIPPCRGCFLPWMLWARSMQLLASWSETSANHSCRFQQMAHAVTGLRGPRRRRSGEILRGPETPTAASRCAMQTVNAPTARTRFNISACFARAA